jgi:hypothetical protein
MMETHYTVTVNEAGLEALTKAIVKCRTTKLEVLLAKTLAKKMALDKRGIAIQNFKGSIVIHFGHGLCRCV